MSELSQIGKIVKALEVAKLAKVGTTLTALESIELLGHIKDLEKECESLNRNVKYLLSHTEKVESIVEGMFPMWIAAMSYCEHGRAADLDRMRSYYCGRDNPLRPDELRALFEIQKPKQGK